MDDFASMSDEALRQYVYGNKESDRQATSALSVFPRQLGHSLFARITRTVVNHETDDWPGDYDRLYALISKVVAQSNLTADAKPLLTRRLIERVAELEKRWPKLKPR